MHTKFNGALDRPVKAILMGAAETLLVLCGLFCFMVPAAADKVTLKSGEVLEGKITEQKDEYLEIRLSEETRRINPGDIVEVKREDLPADFFKTEYKPAEKNGKNKPVIEMSIEAKYSQEKAGEFVDVSGKANLPDGAKIHLFFERADYIISSVSALVKDNVFSKRLGPLNKRLSEGSYEVKADFFSSMQTKDLIDKIKREGYGSNIKSIHAECSLEVAPSGSDLSVTKLRTEFVSYVNELQALNNALDQGYASNKTKETWINWSKKWYPRFKALKSSLEEKNRNEVAIFPKLQQGLIEGCSELESIYQRYEIEFTDPARFKKILKSSIESAYYNNQRMGLKAHIDEALVEVNSEKTN